MINDKCNKTLSVSSDKFIQVDYFALWLIIDYKWLINSTVFSGSLVHCRRSWLEQWERGQWYDLKVGYHDHDHDDHDHDHDDHDHEHDDHDHDHDHDDGHELNGWKAS